jgi:hypothetical protein
MERCQRVRVAGWRINCQCRLRPASLFLKRSCQNGSLSEYPMKQLCRALLFLTAFYGGVLGLYSQTQPLEMNLVVVEGEGQSVNIGEHAHKPPLVRVEDENHRPIAGAVVIFTLPTEGATGDFGGSKTLTVVTDSQGMAPAKGLKVYQLPGKLPIYVNASYRGLTAHATITAYITAPPGAKTSGGGGHGSGKIIAIIAIVGAAAAGGAYYATHSGGGASAPPAPPAPTPIGITPGTGTIGGAH